MKLKGDSYGGRFISMRIMSGQSQIDQRMGCVYGWLNAKKLRHRICVINHITHNFVSLILYVIVVLYSNYPYMLIRTQAYIPTTINRLLPIIIHWVLLVKVSVIHGISILRHHHHKLTTLTIVATHTYIKADVVERACWGGWLWEWCGLDGLRLEGSHGREHLYQWLDACTESGAFMVVECEGDGFVVERIGGPCIGHRESNDDTAIDSNGEWS